MLANLSEIKIYIKDNCLHHIQKPDEFSTVFYTVCHNYTKKEQVFIEFDLPKYGKNVTSAN
jgi:hypothetical protein